MLAPRPWTTESVIRLLWWMLMGLVGVVLAGAGTDLWLRQAPPATRQFYTGLVSILIFHGAVLTGLIRFLRENRMTWSAAFGFHTLALRRVLLIAAGAAVGLFVLNLGLMRLSVLVAVQVLELNPAPQPAIEVIQTSPDPWKPLMIAATALLVAPVMEELLFRGLLYPAVKQAGHPRLALWGTALLFGLSHAHLLSFIPLVVFGLAQVWLYERTNNLLVPIFTHLGFNCINLAFAAAPSISRWLSSCQPDAAPLEHVFLLICT